MCTAQDVVLHGKSFDPRGKFCYRYKTYKGILAWKKTVHHVKYYDFYKDFEKFNCRGRFWFPSK